MPVSYKKWMIMNVFPRLDTSVRLSLTALAFFSMMIPVTVFSQTTDNTLRIYLDCSGEMHRGNVMKTTAHVLAPQLTNFFKSKDLPANLRVIVEPFWFETGKLC